jgi:hypothetical protein
VVAAPSELQERFGVSQTSVGALEAWLKGQGFAVEHVTKDGTSIYASAPLSVIEESLGVDMVDVTKDGYRYAAARQAPSLPLEVAGDVAAIIGLQPYRQARKHLRRAPLLPDNRGIRLVISDRPGAHDARRTRSHGPRFARRPSRPDGHLGRRPLRDREAIRRDPLRDRRCRCGTRAGHRTLAARSHGATRGEGSVARAGKDMKMAAFMSRRAPSLLRAAFRQQYKKLPGLASSTGCTPRRTPGASQKSSAETRR